MGSSKIRKIRTERITKENKRNRETEKGDQGSPSEKTNIKFQDKQDKEHEDVFENNLAEPNEYSKGYQMHKKIHISDLLYCFKDTTLLVLRIHQKH